MKKLEYITFRTDSETKEILQKMAEEDRRTISFVVEEIVKDWLKKHKPETDKQ